jgi:hypothetical protein
MFVRVLLTVLMRVQSPAFMKGQIKTQRAQTGIGLISQPALTAEFVFRCVQLKGRSFLKSARICKTLLDRLSAGSVSSVLALPADTLEGERMAI